MKVDLTQCISVIIPYKNALAKLERLLSSIPQTNQFQIIVVDDNSTEDQNPLTLKYKYGGVEFIQNNTGQHNAGVARNIGLQSARSDWVLFADSDDYFNTEVLNKLHSISSSMGSVDILYFKVDSFDDDARVRSTRHTSYNLLVDKYFTEGDERSIRYKWAPPWGKLIRRSLILDNDIQFDSLIASNDINFSLKIGIYAHGIKVLDDVLYVVSKSSNSLTATLTPEKASSRLQALTGYNLTVMKNDISCHMEYGFTFFMKSKPWKLSASKIKLYQNYFIMLSYRLLRATTRILDGR